jgi:hypothetical protein
MKLFKLVVASTIIFGMMSFAQAAIITTIEAPNVLTSQETGATTIDFEGLGSIAGTTNCPAEYVCFGDYQIRINDGNVNQSAAPFTATPIDENWLTVPNPNFYGTANFELNASYDYFGFFWGSVDSYNTINFFKDNVSIGSFSGNDLSPLLANGAQGNWTSNRFVNFYFTNGLRYDEIQLVSDGYAFETDNHAFANVSEPSIIALLGLSLIGLGLRKRSKK